MTDYAHNYIMLFFCRQELFSSLSLAFFSYVSFCFKLYHESGALLCTGVVVVFDMWWSKKTHDGAEDEGGSIDVARVGSAIFPA